MEQREWLVVGPFYVLAAHVFPAPYLGARAGRQRVEGLARAAKLHKQIKWRRILCAGATLQHA